MRPLGFPSFLAMARAVFSHGNSWARLALVVMVSGWVCGCANRYKVTLTNSNEITTRNKPRLNEERTAYKFKDSQGREMTLPAFRVREIEPL